MGDVGEVIRRHHRLQVLLEVHMEKEERVYLPLLEEHATEEQQQRVLDGMRAAHVEEVG